MKKRVSKFELLRIIAMYLIVLHHSIVHGVLTISVNQQLRHPIATAVAMILGMGGKIGVIIFVLLTGYFMKNSKISFGKIIKIWLPIFFWSIFLFIIFCIYNPETFTLKNLIKSLFPIIFNQYWFMTVYVFMYCMVPILNSIVTSLNTKNKKIYFLIIGTLITISQLPYIFGGSENHDLIGSDLFTFCFVYCIGAFIRENNILENRIDIKRINYLSFLILIVYVGIINIFVLISGKFHKAFLLDKANFLAFNYIVLIPIFLAIGLFIFIGSKNIKYNFMINADCKIKLNT